MNRGEVLAVFLVWLFGSIVIAWPLGKVVDYLKNRFGRHAQRIHRSRK